MKVNTMAQKTKKKPAESTYPKTCEAAVALLAGVEAFQRAQYREVATALSKVGQYLSDVKSGKIKKDATYRDNADELMDYIESIRDLALRYDAHPKAPVAEGPEIKAPKDAYANIAEQAQNAWDMHNALMKKEKKKEEGSKLGLVPKRPGEQPQHYTPKATELPLPSPAAAISPGVYTTQEVPDQIRKYLTTDEDGNYNENQLNALRSDLGNILTGYYNDMPSLAAQGGTSLWNHLLQFYGNEQTAKAAIAGAKPGTMSNAQYNALCNRLVNDLKNGNVDELLGEQYPISEALRAATEYNTRKYENARFSIRTEGLLWLAENNKLRFGIKGGVNIWNIESHEDGTLHVINRETGEESAMPVDRTSDEWLVGGDALAVFELELSPDVAIQLGAGASYDLRQIIPDRGQIWAGDVIVKLLGTGGVADRASLGNYVLSIGGSFGEDYQKYLAKGEGTLTVFPASEEGHFVGIYGLVNAVRETGKGGLFEIQYNALQLALGPKVDLNLLEKGVRGRLSLTAAPTVIIYTDNQEFMDLSNPEALWGAIFGINYRSGEVNLPDITLGASVTESPLGVEGPTGGLVLSVEF